MNSLKDISFPTEMDLLIAFADLTNFSKISSKRTAPELFAYITEIYEMTGDAVEKAGGVVIKFIGDEALCVFPASHADDGIIALLKLKEDIDSLNKNRGLDSQLKVKCHFGSAVIGLTGCRSDKRLDIIGNEVNTCAVLKSNGFAMSAEAFRKMSPGTRSLFKKHTPPVTYIPLKERHKE